MIDGLLRVAEQRQHGQPLIDEATLSEEIPCYLHMQMLDSSIKSQREFYSKACVGQRVRIL